jgi:ABC-type branched-subunit amino acid transport system ATPase component
MLRARDLAVDIQGSRVLRGVSFEVNAGELVCLVGRNGAGKTTTFRTVMGFRKPAAGAITFDGRDIVGMRPHQIARLGVGFAPEESEVFGELTVAENIALPTWTAARRRASTTPTGSSRNSTAIASAADTRCPAASAKWCRSPARWRSTRSSCCSTSRPRACRR